MPLREIDLTFTSSSCPPDVANYLDVMGPLIEQHHSRVPGGFRGFVPCDYLAFHFALAEVVERRLACGPSFCEWGSGLGVATCLAQMLGFEAVGIEIDRELVDAAESSARHMGIAARFVHGSCLPSGIDDLVDDAFAENDGAISMIVESDDAYARLGRDMGDFDVIFAFPWPNDEELTAIIFERFAYDGALLLTYDEVDNFRLRRKQRRP